MSLRPVFFSVCCASQLAFARTLFSMLSRHHPGAEAFLFVSDRVADLSCRDLFLSGHYRLVSAEELGIERFHALSFLQEGAALAAGLRPFALQWLWRSGYDACICLDPEFAVYGPMTEVLEALRQGSEAVLLANMADAEEAVTALAGSRFRWVGAHNAGFLALRRAASCERMVEQWQRLEHRPPVGDPEESGREWWFDLLPGLGLSTRTIRNPGYNSGYWNIGARRVRRGEPFRVEGEPLVLFHFRGVVPGRPDVLSRFAPQLSPADLGDAHLLLQAYLAELFANGHSHFGGMSGSYATFEHGTRIPRQARSFARRIRPAPERPFADLPALLNQPAEDVMPNPGGVVSNLLYEAWRDSPALRSAFPLTSRRSQLALASWFVRKGRGRLGIPPEFVDAVGDRLDRVEPLRLTRVRMALGRLERRTRLVRHGAQRMLGRMLGRGRAFSRRRRSVPRRLQPGVLVVGYSRAEIGLGQALRDMAAALEAGRVPYAVRDVGINVMARQNSGSSFPMQDEPIYRCNFVNVTADQVDSVRQIVGDEFFDGRYNILRPFWELSRLPERWRPVVARFDEIWAPSRFVQRAFARATHAPVKLLPPAVHVEHDEAISRETLGLPADTFLFLFSFDVASYVARKNPLAVVRAFRLAFRPGDKSVALVIKLHGYGEVDDWERRIRRAAGDDGRVLIISGTLDRPRTVGLLANIDCFVSLHRSEGFGLGPAEAMALGKPVIATDYSGTADFVSERTGFPVRHRLVRVEPDEYLCGEGQWWADPDVHHAARLMKAVVECPEEAARRAAAGRRYIEQNFSPRVVGEACRARLTEIGVL